MTALMPMIHRSIAGADMNPRLFIVLMAWLAVLGAGFTGNPPLLAAENTETVRFDIHEYKISGNTLLPEEDIQTSLKAFTGERKTTDDVEKARIALETLYRDAGYPTVMVNIPEQNATDGIIDLQVVEARINNLKIKGNRYFTMGKITRDLPIFAPGEILFLPDAKEQLFKVNMNPDLKVKPVLVPGRDGTVDVVLDVTDKLPLHGSLEVNNRASANTSDLRVNGVIHYDNLWQREHSMSVQFQTSPEDTDEVMALSLSYLIHAPWNYRHLLAAYGVFSDSAVAFGDGFKVKGKGEMAGLRYVMPVEGSQTIVHNVTFGIDYKSFEDTLFMGADDEGIIQTDITPATYTPLSFVYQLSHLGKHTKTTVHAGLTLIMRGVAMEIDEYENKRFKARGNPVVFKTGLEYASALPWHLGLNLKLDAQVTDQPLVPNEQFSAGGMESVRGYRESEVSGDNAVANSVELAFPELFSLFNDEKQVKKTVQRYKFRPYMFYDQAYLRIKDALPGEEQPGMIQGAGLGFRGFLTRYFIYQCDWAWAMNRSNDVEAGDSRGYFRVKWAF